MTNADKIRQMSNDELAELIDDSLNVFSCDECECQGCHWNEPCLPWIKKWLDEECANG